MPSQKTTSTLKGKYGPGLSQAVNEHKADETTFSGGGGLPPGIEGGIAQLDRCYFAQYKDGTALAGEFYFMARGVVKAPREFKGIPIEGQHTQIGPEPMCDTPERKRKTTKEHVAYVLNEMRKLGLDTKQFGDDLEEMAASLEASAPHFRFRTWAGAKEEIVQKGNRWFVGTKSYPSEAAAKQAHPYAGQEPRTQHDWGKWCEYDEDAAAAGGGVVEDDTPPVSARNGSATRPSAAQPSARRTTASASQLPPDDDIPFDERLDNLREEALAENVDAQQEISKLAERYGVKDEVEGAPDWNEACRIVSKAYIDSLPESGAASGNGGDDLNALAQTADAEEPAEDYVPAKGEVVYYKPPKARKAVEVEVTAVFYKSQTCNLKNLDSGASYKTVPWDQLLQTAEG